MKKLFTVLLMLIAIAGLCFSQALNETAYSGNDSAGRYVASTSWVAAIAELGGIDGALCIAPAELQHPAEYEITADDMVKVMNAELFMHAGYEKMMSSIREAAGLDENKVLKVTTTNTLENLEKMVTMLSEKAGTQAEAMKRFGEYKAMIEEARAGIKERGLDKLTVFANTHQAQLARDLGLNVVSTFGAAPLTSGQIAEAAENKYDIAIDNAHGPVAAPISGVSPNTVILVWENFPAELGNNALYNVIKHNLDMLFEAF